MKNQRGSVILITFILMTALIIVIHSILRATNYFIGLAQERENFENKYQKTFL